MDVAGAVAPILDRRLRRDDPRPVAVALSGGGDSVALLLAAHSWARAAGRPLLALTVDHRLQPQSTAWTKACADLAGRLGVAFRSLSWDDAKPATGLPAAARQARHRLLADAARAAGARVLLMGHTADDLREARAMRLAGATTPEPRLWTPSPVWPQGRGLFLLRPLLGVGRAAIRQWLTARGEAWIDDPANADPRYARARARAALPAGEPTAIPTVLAPLALARAVTADLFGGLSLSRQAFRRAPPDEARRLLAIACVCAGGGERLPAGAAVDRLVHALCGGKALTATLSGARIAADDETIVWRREAGEAARRGLAPLALHAGEAVVWDGRFELLTTADGMEVRRLAGLAAALPDEERRRLAGTPSAARPALPAIVGRGGVSVPLLATSSPVQAVSLVADRFAAACGLVAREPA